MILISFCTIAVMLVLLFATFQSNHRVLRYDGIYKLDINTTSLFLFATVLIIVSSFRYGFIDTYAYRIMYESSRDNLKYVFSAPWGVESAWLYFLYLLNKISSDPKLMQFSVALLVIFSYVKTIRKYSCDTTLSLWIFYCLLYMSTNNGMRQYFATAITLLALPFFIEKKYIRYILLILFASLFHTSALFCLIIPLVASGKVLNKRIIVLFIVCAFFMLYPGFSNEKLAIIFSDSKYIDYFSSDKAGMSILRAMVTAIVPGILALLFLRKRKILKIGINYEESVLINLLFVNVVFTIMGTYMQYWARVGSYFSFSSICLMPLMVRNVFTESNQKIIKTIMILLYFVFFAYNIYSYAISGDLNSFILDF